MRTLTVTRIIPAPPDEVFDAFTDHERLADLPGVQSCTLTRTGHTERGGVGAIRELVAGPILLEEQITGFDRPHRMEYRILSSRPAADHEYGQVDFIAVPGGTKVTWTTRFELRVPALGAVIDPIVGLGFAAVFRMVLHQTARRITTGGN